MRILLALLVVPALLSAQTAPRPEDVATLDGIIKAYYDVVSGPVGSLPDPARDETLHHPKARITMLERRADGSATATMITLAEYYQRQLDNFAADGPLPNTKIVDRGFYLQAAFYPIPRKLELYGITSQIYGDKDAGFDNSSEYGVGMNWYPFDTRNHRLNLQVLDVNKSPVSSAFGYYVGGQDGINYASSFSIFF